MAPGLGGLGHLLVQLAKASGAMVIAAVRGPEKLAAARKLGVEAVDYSTPDWPDHVLAITGGTWLTRCSTESAARSADHHWPCSRTADGSPATA